MSNIQIGSIIGAVLAVGIGALGIFLNWFPPADGLGLIMVGLSVLGIHTSGPVSGNTQK